MKILTAVSVALAIGALVAVPTAAWADDELPDTAYSDDMWAIVTDCGDEAGGTAEGWLVIHNAADGVGWTDEGKAIYGDWYEVGRSLQVQPWAEGCGYTLGGDPNAADPSEGDDGGADDVGDPGDDDRTVQELVGAVVAPPSRSGSVTVGAVSGTAPVA